MLADSTRRMAELILATYVDRHCMKDGRGRYSNDNSICLQTVLEGWQVMIGVLAWQTIFKFWQRQVVIAVCIGRQ